MTGAKELEQFLKPAPGIQSDHPEVIALAERIAGQAQSVSERAERLFNFVRDNIRYSVMVPVSRLEDYLALSTLARGRGYCVQKSALLCALARTQGIPCRLSFADIRNQLLHGQLAQDIPDGVIYYHCFVEWRLGGRWIKSTPSFDRALSQEKGWRLVEFSPRAHAMLPDSDLAGRPHVSYLRYHGWRLGVPLDEFLATMKEKYGRQAVALWEAATALYEKNGRQGKDPQ